MGSSDPFIGLVFLATFAGVIVYAAYRGIEALVQPRVKPWAYVLAQAAVTGGLALASLALLARIAS
jgi:hypothetical protein